MSNPHNRYRTFHGRDYEYEEDKEFHDPKNLVYLGEAHKIEYICDKLNGGGDGTEAIYVHKFKKGAKLYMDERGKKQLYILGNAIKVNNRGIIN